MKALNIYDFNLLNPIYTKTTLHGYFSRVYKNVNLCIKVKRCKECGALIMTKNTESKSDLCRRCGIIRGKRLKREIKQKEILNGLTKDEMNLFFNVYYKMLISRLKYKYCVAFENNVINIIGFLKKEGLLVEGKEKNVLNVVWKYVSKAAKGVDRKRERNFSDLGAKSLVKYGLEEYMEDL